MERKKSKIKKKNKEELPPVFEKDERGESLFFKPLR